MWLCTHVWRSWKSLRGGELLCALAVALYLSVESLGPLLDFEPEPQSWTYLALSMGQLCIQALVILLCWLPADRSASNHARRGLRLLAATGLGALGSALLLGLLMPPLLSWLTDPQLLAAACRVCAVPDLIRPSWSHGLGVALNAWVAGGLVVAAYEMHQRRRRSAQALQHLQEEQSRYARDAVAASLAAKKAQMEPQVLFEALLAIESAYARGDPDAASQMDGLIAQLRAAMGRRP
ncbi:hypothetical protein [Paucibacter sp. Y2R2-4]|uniref:hypothetical protein n=1 Tax=Paucibacter sp. Y2R2-4 TaxID=2893553 RepID=UPI0021E4E526|nr:hypothetical protein [Paucibacter sp. Y2R2-4]MCV2351004.1 hypothetical protein [Paucibacter sp. Y2R2-4]